LSGLTATARDVLAAARGLADDLLFPDAMRVDGLDVLPAAHLDALAALGLYGAPVPVEAGGLGLDLAASCAVVEELASGCLATTFVSLALGLVSRCVRLLGPGPLGDELAACRDLLDDAITADAVAMTEARATASELAVRAAAALAVRDGSRSVTVDQHVQRLAREALFLLVFGSRPGIKSDLLRRLGATP
jgi:alkylation response protein AidB-like acyl-CoA dehydrogenase